MSSNFTTVLNQLETAIGQQETGGGTTGVGASQNNPGGLNFADWETAFGATGTPGSSATFPDAASGWAALEALIAKYINGGASISSMMNSYAPVTVNGQTVNPTTPARIASLATLTGLNPNLPINQQLSSSSSTGTVGGAIGGALQSASNTLASATGGALGNTTTNSGGTNTVGSITWSRVVTGLIGLVSLIFGLSMLKQTQVLVQPVINVAKNAATSAKDVALAAA